MKKVIISVLTLALIVSSAGCSENDNPTEISDKVCDEATSSELGNEPPEEIIFPEHVKYSEVRDFSEGLAAVELDGKWGFIDKTGKEVVPHKYDGAGNFYGGIASVSIGVGELVKYGLIDKTGKEVVPLIYDGAWYYSDGLAVVRVGDWETGKCGIIDIASGNEVIPLIYDYISRFSDGLAVVHVGDWETGKCGIIDIASGNEITPIKYDYIDFSWGLLGEGLTSVRIGEPGDAKYGFINKKGEEVVPLKYGYAEDFSEGMAVVSMGDWETGKRGFIDTTGREIVPLKYDRLSGGDTPHFYNFIEDMAMVRLDKKLGFVDRTGKEVIPLIYDDVSEFRGGMAAIKLNGKWGVIDKTGTVIITPKYDYVIILSEGMAKVLKGNLGKYTWGLLDIAARKEVTPVEYDYIGQLSEGLVSVSICEGETSRWGFIDKTGKEVIPLKYEFIPYFGLDSNVYYENVYHFAKGVAAAKLGGKWGFIDNTGKEIVPFMYDSMRPVSDGMAAVFIGDHKTGLWGFVSVVEP